MDACGFANNTCPTMFGPSALPGLVVELYVRRGYQLLQSPAYALWLVAS